MDYTKVRGNITELMCIAAFIDLGYQVSIPYGDSAKYDFVVDVNNKFWRIQCKSSHPAHDHGIEDKNAFSFSTTAQTVNTKEVIRKRYTKEDIDYFATYYDGKVYLIDVNEASTSKTLRLTPPKSNVAYNNAEDYLLTNILPVSKGLEESRDKYINRCNQSSELAKKYCANCGKEIGFTATYCVECSHLLSRKVLRPERNELKAKIRNTSFRALGKEYNVSDKTISKWCLGYNLPSTKKKINALSDEEWFKI